MATPREFKVVNVIPAGFTYKSSVFDESLPSADYTVIAEFDFDAGAWWPENQTNRSIDIVWTNASATPQSMTLFIRWDD